MELTYRSSALNAGIWISAFGLIAMLGLGFLRRRFVPRWTTSENAIERGAARAIGWILP
jgi:hypothetical protein